MAALRAVSRLAGSTAGFFAFLPKQIYREILCAARSPKCRGRSRSHGSRTKAPLKSSVVEIPGFRLRTHPNSAAWQSRGDMETSSRPVVVKTNAGENESQTGPQLPEGSAAFLEPRTGRRWFSICRRYGILTRPASTVLLQCMRDAVKRDGDLKLAALSSASRGGARAYPYWEAF